MQTHTHMYKFDLYLYLYKYSKDKTDMNLIEYGKLHRLGEMSWMMAFAVMR